MPNVCVVVRANGDIETSEIDEWPHYRTIQKAVGGLFSIVPTSFRMEFDESWADEAGRQETVVYCNESGELNGLPANRSGIATLINRDINASSPLVGDLFIVSGSEEFMALDRA